MKLTSLLTPELIKLDLSSTSKTDALEELIGLLSDAQLINDREGFTKAVLERENLCSTGIGRGIAIPHSRTEAITDVSIAMGRSRQGIEFAALDNEPVHLIFLLAAPMKGEGVYLKALARLSRLLRNAEFKQAILEAPTKGDILRIIEDSE
jgi:PTS system fructose-specific IIC component